jgi:hypothetical protein
VYIKYINKTNGEKQMTTTQLKDGINALIKEGTLSKRLGTYALQTLKAGDTQGALRIVACSLRIQ